MHANLAHHLLYNNLDVLIVGINTLHPVYLLHFGDQVVLNLLFAEDCQYVMRIDRAFGQRLAFLDPIAFLDLDPEAVWDLILLFVPVRRGYDRCFGCV